MLRTTINRFEILHCDYSRGSVSRNELPLVITHLTKSKKAGSSWRKLMTDRLQRGKNLRSLWEAGPKRNEETLNDSLAPRNKILRLTLLIRQICDKYKTPEMVILLFSITQNLLNRAFSPNSPTSNL